jgi:hypothetical protein
LKTQVDENELDDRIIKVVCAADASGEPIRVLRGARYDKNMKKHFSADPVLRGVNQGIICTALKRLVAHDFLRYETEKGEQIVLGTREPIVVERDIRILLPA